MRFLHRSLSALILIASFASTARAQTILERFVDTVGTQFGRSVRAAGDVDNDGTDDLLITAIDRVEIYSGATHLRLHSFVAQLAGTAFGTSADACGDVDNDGFADVLIGAHQNDFLGGDSGTVWVHSGRTGAVLAIHHGLIPGDHTGWAVRFVGDLDGDQRDEYALATPYAAGSGQVRIYSGANAVLINVLENFVPQANFGQAIELVGDLDGDGLGELAVLERITCCPATGTLHVVSLPSANELFTIDSPGAISFGNAGDVDGNTIDDIVVGNTNYTANTPLFEIYSGTDGALVATSPDAFAICCTGSVMVTSVADLDGDNAAQEFAVALPMSGAVYVYRGALQISWLYPVGPSLPANFGTSVAMIPDTNGDGFDEVLIGAPPSQTVAGQAWLMSAFALPATSYCTAKVNSLGCTPVIDATGVCDLNGPYAFVPEARNVINQKAGLFVWSGGQQAVPFQGGTLCVAQPLQRSPALNSGGSATGADCTGRLVFNITPQFMWLRGWQLGDEFFGQFWYRDGAHPDGTGTGLSDGLRFRVSL